MSSTENNNFLVFDKPCQNTACKYKARANDFCYRCRRKSKRNEKPISTVKIKSNNEQISYKNNIELTVTLKENPKIIEFSQKIAISSIAIKVVNAQAHWAGLNFTTLSVYEDKIKKDFLKLKERDIIVIEGKIHNRYYPNKNNHKTYFSIEVLKFKKIGKKKKK